MARTAKKVTRRQRIRRGIRGKIKGTAARPRMSVFRSNKDIYVQLVDDISGTTLASATSRSVSAEGRNKTDISKEVGKLIAERAKAAGVETVVFDRGGYLYHGRVKALADSAREGGLKF